MTRPSLSSARPARGRNRPVWLSRVTLVTAALARTVGRRPVPVLVLVAGVGGTAAFAWNALVHQSGRHPAPLFAGSPAIPAPAREMPPPRPTLAASPTPPAAPLRVETPPRPGDGIGTLIRGGDAPPTAKIDPRPDPAKAVPPARVAAAQKALSKLGYGPLEPDGVFGSVTRGALERFERDRKLPVTGAIGGKTARQLASLSGFPLD